MTSHTRNVRLALGMTVIFLAGVAQTALAQVGEPMGAGAGNTFGIRVKQGATTVIDRSNVPFPSDIKINDSTPESSVLLKSLVGGGTDYILKAVSDGGASEGFRTTHWYIDSIKPGDIHVPGATSLFDPSNTGPISVEIYNIKFAGTLTATPLLVGNSTYYTSYMRNEPGHFYNSPEAGTFNQNGMGVIDVQVRGQSYLDGNASQYTFSSTPGGVVSWKWSDIVAPGTTTTVTDEYGVVKGSGVGGSMAGFVHELGLAVSFVGTPIPEPATLSLFALAPLFFRRRRRS